MSNFVILAESGADLPPYITENYNIRVVPMRVALGDVDHDDGTIANDEIFSFYESTKQIPKTSATGPYAYRKAYETIRKQDPDAIIIHICYSKVLSATFQNSLIAEEDMKNIIHIDSKHVTIGQGFIVMNVIQMIEKYPDITPEQITAYVKLCAAMVKFSFVPGNLDFLRAGGRVSNAQFLGAALLRLKPLIEVIDGEMLPTSKISGSMKSIVLHMINDFFKKFDLDTNRVFLVHSGRLDETIKSAVEKRLHELSIKSFLWFEAGAVITSHSGAGGIGIAGILKASFDAQNKKITAMLQEVLSENKPIRSSL